MKLRNGQNREHARLNSIYCYILNALGYVSHNPFPTKLHDNELGNKLASGENIMKGEVVGTTATNVVLETDQKSLPLARALTTRKTDNALVNMTGANDSFEARKTRCIRGLVSRNYGRYIDHFWRREGGGEMQPSAVS